MIHEQKIKIMRLVECQLKNNGSVTSQAVDCRGFDYATVKAHIGATDIPLTALKVTECDTSGGTYVDVTGLRFGTDTNTAGATSALPGSTDDNKFWAFDCDLRYRKRYIKVVATVGNGSTGANIAVWVELQRAEAAAETASERGYEEVLRI